MIFKSDKNFIWQYIQHHKKASIGIILIGIIANVLTILIPVSIGKYYQLLFNLHPRRVRSLKIIPDNWWNTVPKFLILFLALITLRFIFFFLYEYLLRREAAIFIKEIKDFLFNHQLYIHYKTYRNKGIGKYLLRYSGDINSLKNLYVKGSIRVLIDSIMIIIALWWLYKLNHAGSIVIIFLSLFFYLILRWINQKVEEHSLQKRNKTSGQLSFVSRSLHSIINIIAHNKQKTELKKYQKRSEYVKQSSIKYNQWFVINKGFIAFIQYFILTIVLWIFYASTTKHEATQSNLISFILLYITILPVIRRLFMVETVYKLGNISLTKLNHILSLEQESVLSGEKLKVNKPVIQFENVQFHSAQPFFFKVEKCQVNKLKLPKNVSSNNIILALLRIKENYTGTISINRKNIKNFSPHSVRQNIAVSSLQLPFTGKTVYEALTRFRSKRTKTRLQNTYDLLRKKFEINLNLNDPIGENGLQLNDLQKEFLAFARGILQEKPIVIIDRFNLLTSVNPMAFEQILKAQKASVIQIISS